MENKRKTESKDVKMNAKAEKPEGKTKKSPQPMYDFDSYFQLLMKKNPKVREHHKAPMKDYVARKGFKTATKEQFDQALKDY